MEAKKIIIVGGGIAGLSAGVYGRLAGYETHIYEKNPVAGGQCMGWNRSGHHIDNCIHWLTGTKQDTSLYKVWEELGALSEDTEYVPDSKFYTSMYGERRVVLWTDLERTQRKLIELSPEDEEEIRKFIRHVNYAMCCEMPVEKPMDMMGIGDYIRLGKSMADMPKVTKEYGKISMQELANRFHSPLLRKLFTDYLPKDYTASSFLVSYATMAGGNGKVPKGGSLAMVNRIVKRYQDLGGKLYLSMPVRKIVAEGSRAVGVELQDGSLIEADHVICATDTMELFSRLLGKQYMSKGWKKPYENEKDYPLFSGFQTAFSIDTQAYGETGTLFFDCEPFQVGSSQISRMSVKSYEYEPEFAPEGKTVLQANMIQFDEDFRYWKSLSREQYAEKKQRTAACVEERIVKQFPSLKGHIRLLDCWTPLTYERYCNAYHGAYMSFITKKGISSFQEKGEVKGLSNVWIASQWIMAPGGLPVAAAAGKFAIQRILKKEKKKWI